MFCQAMPSRRYSSCSCFSTNSNEEQKAIKKTVTFPLFHLGVTDEKLLQFLVAVVDAKLLETVDVEDLETVNIEHANNRTWYVIASIRPLYFNGAVNSLHNPREKTIVEGLGKFSHKK